jgi:hypothetical protein
MAQDDDLEVSGLVISSSDHARQRTDQQIKD